MLIDLQDIRKISKEDEALVAASLPLRFAKAMRFAFREDQLRSLGASLLMLRHLNVRQESEIAEDEFGKLHKVGGPEFNISHSGNYAAIAVNDSPVGVDIEVVRPENLNVAERVFCGEELQWMRAGDSMERFHILWTRKESAMKACGLGFKLPIEKLNTMPFEKGDAVEIEGRSWKNLTRKEDDCYLSVSWEVQK